MDKLKEVRTSTTAKRENQMLDFLQTNGAQRDFRAPVQVRKIHVTTTTHVYQEILGKLRYLDGELRTRGGKHQRKTKRKSKKRARTVLKCTKRTI